MRDYGRVFSAIWESSDFRRLSEDGRTLVLYLLTCQHGTLAGAFRLPDGYVSEDLQWSSERVAEGFLNLASSGFAQRCSVSKWVWVTKYLHWNPLENPNQRKAAQKIAEKIPQECQWRQAFMSDCHAQLGLPEPHPSEPFPNPSETVPQPVTVTVEGTVEGTGERVDAAQRVALVVASAAAPVAKATATRGTRLPQDWRLPKPWGEWAVAELRLTEPVVRDESLKFRDYWTAKSGKDATKLDWEATWRNWCRNARAAAPSASRPAWAAEREQREAAAAAFAGPYAARKPAPWPETTNTVEVINGDVKLLG